MRIEVYGNRNGAREEFEDALKQQCLKLCITPDLIDGDSTTHMKGALAVVFPDNIEWTDANQKPHSELENSSFALPIIDVATDAANLPKALSKFNAFQKSLWQLSWTQALVDEVLCICWQKRRERQVFISYKRSDSEIAANQLYQELTHRGFKVFLDDISIEKGVDFQRELKWQLNDTDVVLLLLTQNFTNSQWCMEEVHFARANSIGVLVVEWPEIIINNESIAKTIDEDQILKIIKTDFKNFVSNSSTERCLSQEGLNKILAYCLKQRSLAIRQRIEDIVPMAQETFDKGNHSKKLTQIQDSICDFEFIDSNNINYFVRLTPFRPDPRVMHNTYTDVNSNKYHTVYCFYKENDPNDPRFNAIQWLLDISANNSITSNFKLSYY